MNGIIRKNVLNQYTEFFKDPKRRDIGLFLALTLTPLVLLHNHVWGLGATKNVGIAEALRVNMSFIDHEKIANYTPSQWRALVEDKKPVAAVELERRLLEFLFNTAKGELDSTDFDSELAGIFRVATNGSDDAEGDKVKELTKKYVLTSFSTS